VGRRFRNIRQQDLDRRPDSFHSYLAVREFPHRLERGERRDPGKTVPDFDRAIASDQLGQLLGRSEILGVVNLGGTRFVERSEGRDITVCVNREGVHSDTLHGSVLTKSQVN
jgi:hypothetical protein